MPAATSSRSAARDDVAGPRVKRILARRLAPTLARAGRPGATPAGPDELAKRCAGRRGRAQGADDLGAAHAPNPSAGSAVRPSVVGPWAAPAWAAWSTRSGTGRQPPRTTAPRRSPT